MFRAEKNDKNNYSKNVLSHIEVNCKLIDVCPYNYYTKSIITSLHCLSLELGYLFDCLLPQINLLIDFSSLE